jgi:cytochrome c peroxidase
MDVGTGKTSDRSPLIDTPQLTNVGLTAPYLHDGSAQTLEEIWTVFNPKDTHGVTNDLQKDELNDLIEYLKIL